MCGIIGYIGPRDASSVILKGLRTLEYRGYDSAGIAIDHPEKMELRKAAGKVDEAARKLDFASMGGAIGIGHTRWATHGKVCAENAHPHSGCNGTVALVHNGVIENYVSLRESLLSLGHKFSSETDSEVAAHLFEESLKTMAPEKAFLSMVRQLEGSFAIVALVHGADELFAARRNSPLILGIGKGENFFASDIPAVLPYTKKVIQMEDGSAAFLTRGGYSLFSLDGKPLRSEIMEISWSPEVAEKGGFRHFMLKEISEQEQSLRQSLLSDISAVAKMLASAREVHIIACGTSFHAALEFSMECERICAKSAKAFIASEYPFIANPQEGTLAIAITQSGETADTLQAVRFAKSRNLAVAAVTNTVGSSIARLSDAQAYLNAGPEISVAATKTFLCQLAVLFKLAGSPGMESAPALAGAALSQENSAKKAAARLAKSRHIFFIGRGMSYPLAMEGALKLKEISYLHAEAYPGGELKHGPLSLIEEGTPVVAIAPSDDTLKKIISNIKEVKARGAYVIVLTDSDEAASAADFAIRMPKAERHLAPFAYVPVLQLIAYHTSVMCGMDPDRPRNLAKAVTVE
jgi:glutamine---fructose-6-phosphate transaminase (isomerizing)